MFPLTLQNQVKGNLEHFITSLDLSLAIESIFNCYKSSASPRKPCMAKMSQVVYTLTVILTVEELG